MATAGRDAGVSVSLIDGSTLWLFGDTATRGEDGLLEYFVIGTAAWAPPGEPLVTRDFHTDGQPVPFASPGPGFPSCPPGLRPGMWPMSAVAIEADGGNVVYVWMTNVCLGDGVFGTGAGMSLGRWVYDPQSPPDSEPIMVELLREVIDLERPFGEAAMLGTDGMIYLYGCDGQLPTGRGAVHPSGSRRPPWPTQNPARPPVSEPRPMPDPRLGPGQSGTQEQLANLPGPCFVARVAPGEVNDTAAHEFWTGSGWATEEAAAAPMALPGTAGTGAGGGPSVATPPGGFSVVHDPTLGRYAMVYSPWPGVSSQLKVRVADQPTGPWSEPADVQLPDCDDPSGTGHNMCYAGSAQPLFSTKGHIGLGYYDRQVTTNPLRGAYLITTAPVQP